MPPLQGGGAGWVFGVGDARRAAEKPTFLFNFINTQNSIIRCQNTVLREVARRACCILSKHDEGWRGRKTRAAYGSAKKKNHPDEKKGVPRNICSGVDVVISSGFLFAISLLLYAYTSVLLLFSFRTRRFRTQTGHFCFVFIMFFFLVFIFTRDYNKIRRAKRTKRQNVRPEWTTYALLSEPTRSIVPIGFHCAGPNWKSPNVCFILRVKSKGPESHRLFVRTRYRRDQTPNSKRNSNEFRVQSQKVNRMRTDAVKIRDLGAPPYRFPFFILFPSTGYSSRSQLFEKPFPRIASRIKVTVRFLLEPLPQY